jgi:hypothetical protein
MRQPGCEANVPQDAGLLSGLRSSFGEVLWHYDYVDRRYPTHPLYLRRYKESKSRLYCVSYSINPTCSYQPSSALPAMPDLAFPAAGP